MSITRLLLFVLFFFGLFHVYLFTTRDPGFRDPMVAQDVANDTGFSSLAVALEHTCALATGGSVWCWGQGAAGQLGHGLFASSTTPVPVVGLPARATRVAVGVATSCAVLVDATLWCWGSSMAGQIGLPNTTPATAHPQRIMGLARVSEVALGHNHICATETGGRLACWGDRRMERGGAVYLEQHASPQYIANAPILHALQASDSHTCGITPDQEVACWGGADNSALGVEDGRPRRVLNTPTLIPLDAPVTAVALGSAHTCALTTTDTVQCWGNPMGYADTSGRDPSTPLTVFQEPGIQGIANGWSASCALLANGVPTCVGDAQQGPWPPFPSSTPTLTSLVAQGQRLCGLDQEGGAWCTPLQADSVLTETINHRPSSWRPDNRLSTRWDRLAGLWVKRTISLASAP